MLAVGVIFAEHTRAQRLQELLRVINYPDRLTATAAQNIIEAIFQSGHSSSWSYNGTILFSCIRRFMMATRLGIANLEFNIVGRMFEHLFENFFVISALSPPR